MLCVRQPAKEIKTNISACIATGTGHNAQLSPSLTGATLVKPFPKDGVGGGGGLGGGGRGVRGAEGRNGETRLSPFPAMCR